MSLASKVRAAIPAGFSYSLTERFYRETAYDNFWRVAVTIHEDRGDARDPEKLLALKQTLWNINTAEPYDNVVIYTSTIAADEGKVRDGPETTEHSAIRDKIAALTGEFCTCTSFRTITVGKHQLDVTSVEVAENIGKAWDSNAFAELKKKLHKIKGVRVMTQYVYTGPNPLD